MKRHVMMLSTAGAIALASMAPGFAQNDSNTSGGASGLDPAMLQQMADQAGVTEEQAMGMSLNELAALKYNRDHNGDEDIEAFDPANPAIDDAALAQLAENAGITVEEARVLSLSELGALVYNSESTSREGEEIAIGDTAGGIDQGTLQQLAAQAGITVEEARQLTLTELTALVQNETLSSGDDDLPAENANTGN